MENKTIIILSHVGFDDSPYCSYVQAHAKALVEQGYHVKVFAMIPWFPFFSYFQKKRRSFLLLLVGFIDWIANESKRFGEVL